MKYHQTFGNVPTLPPVHHRDCIKIATISFNRATVETLTIVLPSPPLMPSVAIVPAHKTPTDSSSPQSQNRHHSETVTMLGTHWVYWEDSLPETKWWRCRDGGWPCYNWASSGDNVTVAVLGQIDQYVKNKWWPCCDKWRYWNGGSIGTLINA